MNVADQVDARRHAQREAFDRILATTCSIARSATTTTETARSTTRPELLDVEHQAHPFPPKPYDGGQHQSLLPLRSRPMHPLRPLRRGLPECPGQRDLPSAGKTSIPACCGTAGSYRRIELRLLRALRHGLSLQRADGKIHARPCRLSSPRLPQTALKRHDRRRQRHRAGDRLRRHPAALRGRSGHARAAHPQNQDGLHLLRRRLQLRRLDQGPPHPQRSSPRNGPANGISTCIKGKFGWDFVNSPRPPDQAADPRRRHVPRGELGRGARPDRRRFTEIKASHGPDALGVHLFVEMHQRRELPDAEAGARGDRHQQHRQLLALLPGAGDRACSAPSATAAIPARSRTSSRPAWWSSSAATPPRAIRSWRPA